MGIFSKLFGGGQGREAKPFQTEAEHDQGRRRMVEGGPVVLEQLRNHGITDASQLKLEYFFYTNTEEKAKALAADMIQRGYSWDCERAAGNKKLFVITGWTELMFMDELSVLAWVGQMCDAARTHDCEFDGWGTNPEQLS